MLGCAFVVAALVIACAEPTAPLPTGAIEWSPPARFALWWQMTESCSGQRGDLQAIRWYVVPNATSIDLNGERVQGETIGNDRIVLVESHRLDGPLVRHEMLHALLRGASGHPRDAFLIACDGVVVCDGTCDTEAGGRPAPPLDAPELAPRDVATRVEVVPGNPAASNDSGAVAVIVSITNPLATPAWVRLASAPGDAIASTFGVAIDYNDGGRCCAEWANNGIVGTRFPLAANETRRYVWDGDLLPGDYGIRGWFSDDTAPRFVLKVGP